MNTSNTNSSPLSTSLSPHATQNSDASKFRITAKTPSPSTIPPIIHTVLHSPQTAQQLHHEFVKLGGMKLKLKNKMLAILPEIYKSGIWKKYAGSIVEYSGKYGDISKTTVVKRLRLEENLKDKPYLKAAIEKVGVHKVAMVAKIATPATDKILTEHISNMSKLAVQSLSKELRAGQALPCGSEQQISFGSFVGQTQSLPCKAVTVTKKIELDEYSTFLFLKLKAKLGKNLSDKEFVKTILEEREKLEFPEVKGRAAKNFINETLPEKLKTPLEASNKSVVVQTLSEKTIPPGKIGRHIPANKKRKIIQQTNGKCSYPNCNSPYEVLHHTDRYSESKNHDSVIPLCKIHHEFAHNNLIQNELQNTNKWQLSMVKLPEAKISQADILNLKYRREAIT